MFLRTHPILRDVYVAKQLLGWLSAADIRRKLLMLHKKAACCCYVQRNIVIPIYSVCHYVVRLYTVSQKTSTFLFFK